MGRARQRAVGGLGDVVGSRSGETLSRQGRDFLSRRWPQALPLSTPWLRAAAQSEVCGIVLLQLEPWSQHAADPEAEFWNEMEGPQHQWAVFRVIDRVLFPQSKRIPAIRSGSVASMRRFLVALEPCSLAPLRTDIEVACQRWHVCGDCFTGLAHTSILLAPLDCRVVVARMLAHCVDVFEPAAEGHRPVPWQAPEHQGQGVDAERCS